MTGGGAQGAGDPADGPRIRRAFGDAEVHPMLCAVAHITGDFSLLRPDLAPDQTQMLVPGRGLSAEQEAEARELAAAALERHRAEGSPDHELTDEELTRLLAFIVGPDAVAQWTPFLTEELALGEPDLRAPSWRLDDLDRPALYRAAVVGAGFSGLAAAHRLREAGIDVTVFEKNDDVGGTWLENVYPGCRVDVPNQLYSFSFAQSNEWASRFSSQPDLLSYLRRVAGDLQLVELIRFASEVVEAVFSAERAQWEVRWRHPDGSEASEWFDVLVGATGQLNRPSFPEIAGRDRFAGPSFHSAAWDQSVSLVGQRVAVIGTGASAAQFVPCIADEVAHLDLYQRTPPWLLPTDNYGDPFSAAFHDLLALLPGYGRWDRLWQFWLMHEGLLPAARVDPGRSDVTLAVGAVNEFVREMLVDVLRSQVKDDELFERMVPRFSPFSKRALRDDGRWADAVTRPNVDLITTPIAEITEGGVRTEDGVEHQADVLIYGTGFRASHFVAPMRVVGLGGVELNQEWGGDARAFLGLTVPGFPNFFLLYGPNTNLVINGSIIVMVECQVRYLVEWIGALLKAGHRAMTCRRVVHDRYAEEMEAGNARMAWGVADVPTWYRNANGRVTQNWPFDLHSYWAQTRTPDLGDYELV